VLACTSSTFGETLRYGTGGDDADMPDAEILAVAVGGPRCRDTVWAAHSSSAALATLHAHGIDTAHVVTAVGNEPALACTNERAFVAIGAPKCTVAFPRGARMAVIVAFAIACVCTPTDSAGCRAVRCRRPSRPP
jgi:hypothetical protein